MRDVRALKGMPMKLRIAIVLLVLSTPSHADGPIPVDPPEGFDRARYPDASFTKSVYTIDVKRRGERKAKERYQKQDCGIDARSTGDFFCDGKGTSPLAGTRYVRIKELTKCRGTLLMCSTGCG